MLQYNIKQKGMIFISVLIFLQLITLLGLYLLQASFITSKMSAAYLQHYMLFSVAKERLQYIETDLLSESDTCKIPIMTRRELMEKNRDWWKAHSCVGKINEISYYYVIESLASNICVKLNDSDSLLPIEYFRITLLAYSKNKVFRETLQSVVAKLDNTKRDCASDKVEGHLGRQSLRRL